MVRAKVPLTALVLTGVLAGVLVSGSAVASKAAATLTIQKASCEGCKWRQGWFKGSVKFSASVSGASQLKAVVRSAKTHKVLIKPLQFSVGAGTFTKTMRLNSRPLPTGSYRVELTGTSGGVTLPQATKSFSVPTPVEGVADRSYATKTRNGSAVRVVPHGAHVIYAHFHFLQRPEKPGKVRFTWRRPDYSVVGTVTKTYRDTFWTYVLARGSTLEPGTYYCYLRVAGKTAKALSVRVL
jgi:hypothetical protein